MRTVPITTGSMIQAINPDQPLYFLHIPKTAGTSLTSVLDRCFANHDIFQPQLWWDVGSVDAARNAPHRFFRGHFGVGGQILSAQTMQIITMVRDPIKLAHSTYQYILKEPSTNKHAYVVGNRLDFKGFLQDPKTQKLASNRLLKSVTFCADALHQFDGAHVDPENYRQMRKRWNATRKAMSPEDQLTLAKQQLDRCVWVGLTECFDESLLHLSYLMGKPPFGTVQNLNQSQPMKALDAETEQLLIDLNALDLELYAYAKKRFESQRLEIGAALGVSNLSDLGSWQRQVDGHHQTRCQPQLNRVIDHDFSQPLTGQNWHEREWLPQHQHHFRWTGPEQPTTIDFWLLPGDCSVRISLCDSMPETVNSSLMVRVNDLAVDWSIEDDAGHDVITFTVSSTARPESGLLRIELLSEPSSHHSRFNSGDLRKVGLAVSHISIKSQTGNTKGL